MRTRVCCHLLHVGVSTVRSAKGEIKFFLRQNGSDRGSLDAGLNASKNQFFFSKEASRGSWASGAPGSRPAASQPPACPVSSARRVAAALRRRQRQLQQGLPALHAADGHGVHGPQLLHVAVLRVEAPRRVRRRSEGARVLHRLHAPVREVLVVLELVGVVLEDPELCGRLLLHVLAGAVQRLVGPRVVGPGRPLEVVAPLPALARHPRGQVLLPSGCPGPPRQWRCGPRAALSSSRRPLSAPARRAWWPARRLGVLVLQRSRVKTSITTRPYFVFPRVFWLKSMRSACSRSFGPLAADLPTARGRGACTCRPTSALRPWPASRRGRAAWRVGTASAGPAR